MTNQTGILIRDAASSAMDIRISSRPIADIATVFNNYFSVEFAASVFNNDNIPASKCASIIDHPNLTSGVVTNILNHPNLGTTKKNAILAISTRW